MATLAEALAVGAQYLQAGQLAEAERILRQVLQAAPRNAQALFLLGTVALQARRFDVAVQLIGEAIRVDDSQGVFFANLGEAHRHLGNFAEAIRHSEQAIKLQPSLASAHLNLGLMHRQQRNIEAAIRHSRAAIKIEPRLVGAYLNLGLIYQQQNDLNAAAEAFREAVRVVPDDPQARNSLGRVLVMQGNLPAAEACFRRAARAAPHDPRVLFNLGGVLYAQGNPDEAVDRFREALALAPNDPEIHSNLANILGEQGRMDESLAFRRSALQRTPNNARTHSDLLYVLNFQPDADAAHLWGEHRAWGQRHADPLTAGSSPHAMDRSTGRPLRVGYVSAHFWSHAVNFFIEPILAAHDRAAFEVFCYSDAAQAQCDDATARVRGHADCWRDIVGNTDQQVSELIRADKIDILVDLAGHIGGNRLLVFARKPAPVQVTYIGYQNTTGMLAMDYRLTDAWADPPGTTDAFYTEKLVRLPRTFFCYLPSADAPAVIAPPVVANGFVTFGSFNNFVKITPPALAAWADILRGVSNSRLLVLAKVSPRLQEYVHTTFQRYGIPPERVELCPHRPRRDYLELIARADVALDSFPFNGHTTTCDALWQGVPMVTPAGESYFSRFGSSAHVNLGLEDLIARSTQKYVQIATDLAGNRDRLAELRAALRARMLESPLLDAHGFARNLEEAYRQMWANWCGSH